MKSICLDKAIGRRRKPQIATLRGCLVTGATRCFHLSDLVKDSEIFVPMFPLKDDTCGLVTAELIDALPHGSLVVQVTRAAICDTDALYRRVLNDELALAADVFYIKNREFEIAIEFIRED